MHLYIQHTHTHRKDGDARRHSKVSHKSSKHVFESLIKQHEEQTAKTTTNLESCRLMFLHEPSISDADQENSFPISLSNDTNICKAQICNRTIYIHTHIQSYVRTFMQTHPSHAHAQRERDTSSPRQFDVLRQTDTTPF